MSDNIRADILKEISDTHKITYNILKTPWPLKNRDMQVDFTIRKDFKKGVVAAHMTAYPEPIVPLSEKNVRITDFELSCELLRMDDTTTKVIYIGRVNPMVPVPKMITSLLVKYNPYATLSGLKKMVLKERYLIKKESFP